MNKYCGGNCNYYSAEHGHCDKLDMSQNHSCLCTGWERADYVAENANLKNDEVNHPKHYNQLPIECKDVIKYFDACRGQAIKYIWRCEDKNNRIQDLEKAIFWIKEKIKMYQEEDNR